MPDHETTEDKIVADIALNGAMIELSSDCGSGDSSCYMALGHLSHLSALKEFARQIRHDLGFTLRDWKAEGYPTPRVERGYGRLLSVGSLDWMMDHCGINTPGAIPVTWVRYE